MLFEQVTAWAEARNLIAGSDSFRHWPNWPRKWANWQAASPSEARCYQRFNWGLHGGVDHYCRAKWLKCDRLFTGRLQRNQRPRRPHDRWRL